MRIVATYWLCSDCTCYACNGDTSGIEYYQGEEREAHVVASVNALEPISLNDTDRKGRSMDRVSYDWDLDCDACAAKAGTLTRFAKLSS